MNCKGRRRSEGRHVGSKDASQEPWVGVWVGLACGAKIVNAVDVAGIGLSVKSRSSSLLHRTALCTGNPHVRFGIGHISETVVTVRTVI